MTTTYDEQLQQEAALWGSVDAASTTPPDWALRRTLLHNAIMHTADIDALLAQVTPGMRTLELGCGPGWLTHAMAKRGAHATGMDISEQSLEVARAYYEQTRADLPGTADYHVADLNRLQLEPGTYDIIVTKGTLHHLLELEHVIGQVYAALKPGGLFWASDQDGDEALHTALAASALMFVLPTTVSYADKFAGLAKFGADAPSRIKASMEAEGLSPFEGAGRDHDWVTLIEQQFVVERKIVKPAITGYMAHQLNMPEKPLWWTLRAIKAVDALLVKLGILHSTGVILYARKPL
ncbi:MAG: class I SAM-dependent methyltransferase [Chloroflexota bacterium]